MFTAVSDWSEALLTSLAGATTIFRGDPGGRLVLRRIRFNELATKSGFGEFVNVSKWFIRLMVLVTASAGFKHPGREEGRSQ